MPYLKFQSIKYIFLLFFNILIFPSIIQAANKKVTVIVPLENEAMVQIVYGISESLQGTNSDSLF